MRGKPLERETSDLAMIATGPSAPSGPTRRTLLDVQEGSCDKRQ